MPVAPRGKGTVESCTLCVHRIDRDGANAVPACAEAVNQGDRKAICLVTCMIRKARFHSACSEHSAPLNCAPIWA